MVVSLEGRNMLFLHVYKSKSSHLVSWLLKWRGLASGSLHGTLPVPVHVIHVRACACTGIIAGGFSPLVLFLLVPFPSGSMKDSSVQLYLEIIHQLGTPNERPAQLAQISDSQINCHSNGGHEGHLSIKLKSQPQWSVIYSRKLVTTDINVGSSFRY